MTMEENNFCLRVDHLGATILGMDIEKHLKDLRERLALCRATRKQLAAETGGRISASWVSKFAAGRMTNPRVDTLLALEDALDRLEFRGTDRN